MLAPFSTVTDDALADHDMVGLLAELAAGRVNSNELFAAAWERAERAEPLNAVVSWVPPSTSVDGPFAGIPTFVKDDEEVQGVATTNGSRAVPDTPAEEDSPFAQQLRQLGLAFVGKSALPEFGLMPTTEPLAHGPTRNPWDLSRSTGGSSGGAAALVAAGVVPIATGNDGGGSIRIPASCCGVVGLKPSRNRLQPTAEAEILPLDIITYGVHTRSVRDTAAFYREIEKIRCELPPIGDVVGPGRERLRIGLLEDPPGGPADPVVVKAVADAAALCESLGHHVESVPFPGDMRFGKDFLRFWGMMAKLIQIGGKRFFGPEFDRSLLEPSTKGLCKYFTSVAFNAPASVLRLRSFAQEFEQSFVDHDVLLSPVLSSEPVPIGVLAPDSDFHELMIRLVRYVRYTALQNVSGAPAISLPLGRGVDGLPIGVQFAAAYGQDRRLIELAYELEAAAPWRYA